MANTPVDPLTDAVKNLDLDVFRSFVENLTTINTTDRNADRLEEEFLKLDQELLHETIQQLQQVDQSRMTTLIREKNSVISELERLQIHLESLESTIEDVSQQNIWDPMLALQSGLIQNDDLALLSLLVEQLEMSRDGLHSVISSLEEDVRFTPNGDAPSSYSLAVSYCPRFFKRLSSSKFVNRLK